MSLMSQSDANEVPCDGSSGLPLVNVRCGPVVEPVLTDESQRLMSGFASSVSNYNPITNHNMLPVLPRLILHGLPGTGKSHTAYHAFSKLNLPYCFVIFDAIISSHPGATANNIRKIFAYASSMEHGIIFDDIDIFARKRLSGDESKFGFLIFSRSPATLCSLTTMYDTG